MNQKQQLALLVLQALSDGPKSGYQLAKAIKAVELEALNFKEGMLYPVLHNLEKHGLIEAVIEEGKNQPRRIYYLTEPGQNMLHQLIKELALAGNKRIVLGRL
jgi:PadR family transcriptional regulator, regulatory protein PadR